MSAATEGYHVSRTLRALEALAIRPLTSGELAELIGINSRTARRLLTRLALEEYVARVSGHRYRYGLTLRLPELAAHALLNHTIVGELARRAGHADGHQGCAGREQQR